jgi:hypothetical protein
MTKNRKPLLRKLYLASVCLIATLAFAACGDNSGADSDRVTPTIIAAKMFDEGVEVKYSAPGADGGEWPVLRISVRETEGSLPARSEFVRSVEEEGTVMVPIEVEPGRDLTVYGSIFYEDGERVPLAEKHIRS